MTRKNKRYDKRDNNVKKLLLVREGFPKSLKRTMSRALLAPEGGQKGLQIVQRWIESELQRTGIQGMRGWK